MGPDWEARAEEGEREERAKRQRLMALWPGPAPDSRAGPESGPKEAVAERSGSNQDEPKKDECERGKPKEGEPKDAWQKAWKLMSRAEANKLATEGRIEAAAERVQREEELGGSAKCVEGRRRGDWSEEEWEKRKEWVEKHVNSQRLETLLKKAKSDKAGGSSGFNAYMLKKSPVASELAVKWCRAMAMELDWPREWKRWEAALVHKGKGKSRFI